MTTPPTTICETCNNTGKVLHMWERPGGLPGNGWGPCPTCGRDWTKLAASAPTTPPTAEQLARLVELLGMTAPGATKGGPTDFANALVRLGAAAAELLPGLLAHYAALQQVAEAAKERIPWHIECDCKLCAALRRAGLGDTQKETG